MIILDTNIVSEAMRAQPHPNVMAWMDRQPAETLYLCAPVLAEIRQGVEQLPDGRKRELYAAAADRIEDSVFAGRILPFDVAAAREFGRVVAHRRRIGRPVKQMDALIAAIALTHGAALSTRDISDFAELGLELIDPFVAS